MQHFQVLIPDMLAGGVRVMIYAGDMDFICNYKGNKAWTLALDWPYHGECWRVMCWRVMCWRVDVLWSVGVHALQLLLVLLCFFLTRTFFFCRRAGSGNRWPLRHTINVVLHMITIIHAVCCC